MRPSSWLTAGLRLLQSVVELGRIVVVESVFLVLAVLGRPVGMGLMMWFMAKGNKSSPQTTTTDDRSSVEELRAEQQRLAAAIERLDEHETEPVGGRP